MHNLHISLNGPLPGYEQSQRQLSGGTDLHSHELRSGDVVWAHRSGDFLGKYRPMLIISNSGTSLLAYAFTTERHHQTVLVEATGTNGQHHESWLSLVAEDLVYGDIAALLGELDPGLFA